MQRLTNITMNSVAMNVYKEELKITKSINDIQGNQKENDNKYNTDIIQILKYAEENNPHCLLQEISQNLKWENTIIESQEINENNTLLYKTKAKLKTFYGEGIGITKKQSKGKI
jgi:hypothetical protein